MIGIYKIVNPSGDVYIGQSWDLYKRWNRNYKYLQCKGQIKLYNSLKKHGWEGHSFEILHELSPNTTQEELDKLEIDYVKKYKEIGLTLLNLREGGKGGKLSKETTEKIKNKSIIRWARRITQFSKEGKFIKTWNSIPEAAEKLKIKSPAIKANINGKTLTCGKFIFKDGFIIGDIKVDLSNRWKTKNIRKKRIGLRTKHPIYQLDMRGNFIKEWQSATYAAEILCLNRRCISLATLGKLKQTGGFRWKKKVKINTKRSRIISLINVINEVLTF